MPVLCTLANGTVDLNNPLLWWATNAQRFPRVSALAAKYLAIQATSASSERLFSTAGLTIANDRAALRQDNAAMLVFIHENYALVNDWRIENNLVPL